jgi:hypothetical protein
MASDRMRDRVVMSGTYAGSMLIDDRLLINNISDLSDPRTSTRSWSASPCRRRSTPRHATPPMMSHVPLPIVVQATGPEGANVFFLPPTAIDDGNAGATVACAPAPSTTFSMISVRARSQRL